MAPQSPSACRAAAAAGVAAAAAALGALAAPPQPSIRVMPLGDSITEWQCNNESQGGWRNFLGNTMHGAGVVFDFVGSQYGCGNHEGHSGWTAAQLLGIAPASFAAHSPDVILLQAGTNDLFFYNQPGFPPSQGANVTGTVARLDALIAAAFAALPNATVMLSGVTYINATRCANYSSAPWHPPDCPADMQPNIVALNAALPAMVEGWVSKGFDVNFHDPNPDCNFTAADYWTWGIHFTESGYAKIAASWWKALQPLLSRL
jgi:lysophospholipase L1-like esterase